MDRDWLAALTARLARRMEFALTVADRHVYLSLGAETLTCAIRRVELSEYSGRGCDVLGAAEFRQIVSRM